MSKDLQAKFESQLPKIKKLDFPALFNYIAGGCSIIGLLAAPYLVTDPSSLSFIYMVFLTIIVFVLMAHAYFIEQKKLYRYAQSTIFSHYVIHLIRDELAMMEKSQGQDIKHVTEKILNATATCFSILTGKQCRCAIVEIEDNDALKVASRDSISTSQSKKKNEIVHKLDMNTDFKNLWYAINGCSRYYLCNDLPKSWKQHKYQNSSFQQVGEPVVESFLGFDYISEWNLPYKSALVLPIRHISEFSPPDKPSVLLPHWNYYGFLCIDCDSKNSFDVKYAPEFGGALADALFILFTQAEYILDQLTTPLTKTRD